MCAITLTDVTDECALPGMLVARDGGMQITDRHRWLLVATLAGFVASKLATQLASATWMVADGNDPPEDPTDRNFAWMPALVFGAAAGAAAGMADVVARNGAGAAWKRVTGKKPPRPKKRSKRN